MEFQSDKSSLEEFKGLTAVVTGAGAGIGLEVAKQLFNKGARVFGFDINQGAMEPYATFIYCDISNTSSVKKAFVEFNKISKQLDVLINNAGISLLATVEHRSDEIWEKTLNVNVMGTARVSREAIPLLRSSKFAAIVNTASISATNGIQNMAAYSASKGAVLSLTLAMAADHLNDGIRVNAVSPSITDTPRLAQLLNESADTDLRKKGFEEMQPIGRLISPVEVARAITFLASPLQASITGTNIKVDGGSESLRVYKK